MSCRVLGPVQVCVDGRLVELGGPTVRRALAALSVAVGVAVADDVLAEQVWGADLPAGVTNALRVVISRLRAALGMQGREILQRNATGYLLALTAEQTDVGEFTALVELGLSSLRHGDAAVAAGALGEALGLWRGEPWADLGDGLHHAGARHRLIELHAVASEEWLGARLNCGEVAAAVAGLGEAVTAAPYRERRWELLALGLYRSGRQVQALAELRRVRELLVDELGVEPGPALRSLEQRMLDHDPTLIMPTDAPTLPASPAPIGGRRIRPTSALTSFVGRDRELDDLDTALDTHRLVTVVGPAGVGKTRLAIEYVREHQSALFCTMAELHDGGAVASALAAAVGLTYLARDPLSAFCDAVGDDERLLIVDNCEHLVEPIGGAVATVLTRCPGLRVLATSRHALHVEGEQLLPLQPLPVTTSDGDDGPAVQLLAARVSAHHGRLGRPDSSDLRAVCEAADGLPLAIELAAARTRAISLRDIAIRLRDRLDVLGRTLLGSPSPHESLTAAIGWSVDLLSAADRALLLRLWTFEGGFTWQAARSVQAHPAAAAVLATLTTLVDRSLLTVDAETDGQHRYRMLETIRRYCAAVDPDPAGSRRAHAEWAHQLIAELAPWTQGVGVPEVANRLGTERANLRAAIAHDLAIDPAAALRATAELRGWWVCGGFIADGITLIGAALDAAATASDTERASALLVLSALHWYAGDEQRALEVSRQALGLLAEDDPGQTLLILEAHSRVCNALIDTGRLEELRAATDAFVAAMAVADVVPPQLRCCALFSVAQCHRRGGNRRAAVKVLTECIALADRADALAFAGVGELMRAWCYLERPDASHYELLGAMTGLERAASIFVQQDNVSDLAAALYASCYGLAQLGHTDAARRLHDDVLAQAERVGTNPRRYAPVDIEPRLRAALTMAPSSAPMDHLSMDRLPMDHLRAEMQLFASAATDLIGRVPS